MLAYASCFLMSTFQHLFFAKAASEPEGARSSCQELQILSSRSSLSRAPDALCQELQMLSYKSPTVSHGNKQHLFCGPDNEEPTSSYKTTICRRDF
jgi:hypothetical protein